MRKYRTKPRPKKESKEEKEKYAHREVGKRPPPPGYKEPKEKDAFRQVGDTPPALARIRKNTKRPPQRTVNSKYKPILKGVVEKGKLKKKPKYKRDKDVKYMETEDKTKSILPEGHKGKLDTTEGTKGLMKKEKPAMVENMDARNKHRRLIKMYFKSIGRNVLHDRTRKQTPEAYDKNKHSRMLQLSRTLAKQLKSKLPAEEYKRLQEHTKKRVRMYGGR